MWKRERIGLEIKKVGCVTAEIMWSDTEEEWILYAKPGNNLTWKNWDYLKDSKKKI